jgi:hypothetical protein
VLSVTRVSKPVRVSQELFAAVKLADEPAYVIAERADIRPDILSKLLHGAERLKPQDERVLRVARIVGVPAERAFA